MSKPYRNYLTCVKKYCGIRNDPVTGQPKYQAEKNSDYISNFVYDLGHPTKAIYQTKVFDVAENPNLGKPSIKKDDICHLRGVTNFQNVIF